MITVEELMTKELYTLHETDSVLRAHNLMVEKKIRHIPIVDRNNMFTGLLTQRDVLSAAVSVFAEISEQERMELEGGIPIREVMTKDIVVAELGTDLREIARHLLETKHGCLPVVSEGFLLGIITEADFVKLAIRLLDRLAEWESMMPRH